jgi:ABC-type spermidine/putrescine transport system permease subunit II
MADAVASSATIALLRLCRWGAFSAKGAKAAFVTQSTKVESMADWLSLVMLVGASIASLAFGVFAAYGILRAGFALIRPRPQVVVKAQARAEMAQIS